MRVKAAVLRSVGMPLPYAGSNPLDIVEVDLARPGPGEVRVRIKAAGLCHSDLSASFQTTTTFGDRSESALDSCSGGKTALTES